MLVRLEDVAEVIGKAVSSGNLTLKRGTLLIHGIVRKNEETETRRAQEEFQELAARVARREAELSDGKIRTRHDEIFRQLDAALVERAARKGKK